MYVEKSPIAKFTIPFRPLFDGSKSNKCAERRVKF